MSDRDVLILALDELEEVLEQQISAAEEELRLQLERLRTAQASFSSSPIGDSNQKVVDDAWYSSLGATLGVL